RVKELSRAGFFTKEDATTLIEALEILNTLRLDAQLEKLQKKQPIDNFL
ncbi:MAG TPA: hypothetical protein ENL00_01465, partial [Nitratifractor sp.]|nr:hypothetical protein [Nitratifractor sp.]